MPSLKDLRNRIASVKATQKITKAMQMVAAAKLRRAQEAAEAPLSWRWLSPALRASARSRGDHGEITGRSREITGRSPLTRAPCLGADAARLLAHHAAVGARVAARAHAEAPTRQER